MKTRIIVCGGRDFADEDLFIKSMDEILPQYEDVEIVSGHAKGADTFGERYAEAHGIPVAIFKADWKKYGRGAGPVRNKEMLEYAKQESPVIIAFWDGKSKGTKNMIDQGTKANAKVHVVRYGE